MKERDWLWSLLPVLAWTITMPLFMTSTEMWLGGIGISLALFLAGLSIHRRQSRIDRVVKSYLDSFTADAYENGLARLLKCGVVELKNRRELKEVCRGIQANGKNHPNYYDEISNAKLLAFLKFCHKNGHTLESGSDSLIVQAQFDKTFPPDT